MASNLVPLRIKIETLPLLAANATDKCLKISEALAWPDGTIDILVTKPIADTFGELTVDEIHETLERLANAGG